MERDEKSGGESSPYLYSLSINQLIASLENASIWRHPSDNALPIIGVPLFLLKSPRLFDHFEGTSSELSPHGKGKAGRRVPRSPSPLK